MFKATVRKYEDTLKNYQKLFIEDGKGYMKEQESLDKLFDTIKSIELKLKQEENAFILKEFPIDNPINKKISGNFNVTLESFVTIKDWSLKKIKKEFIREETIELDSEFFETFQTQFNTEVELFIWSRAQLIDYNNIEDNYVLELEK